MATVAFFNLPASGHVNPTLDVARVLVEQGHRVLYYNTNEFRDIIEATGAEFRGLEQFGTVEYSVTWPFDILAMCFQIANYTEKVVKLLTVDLKNQQVDAVVTDFMCIWGALAAKHLNLPILETYPTFLLNPWDYISPKHFHEIGHFIKPTRISEVNALAKHFAKLTTWAGRKKASKHTIIFTSEYFHTNIKLNLKKNLSFVGPSTNLRKLHGDVTYEPDEAKTAIYISLGTLFNNKGGFYQECFQAFGDDDTYQIYISVGKTIDINDLGDVPSNITVQNTFDQLAVLEVADVFITHGGFNSTTESIIHDVPMVFVPQICEQDVNAKRAAKLGAGIRLSAKQHTATHLREAVETIQADRDNYCKAVAKIKSSFDHTESLADLLAQWLPPAVE